MQLRDAAIKIRKDMGEMRDNPKASVLGLTHGVKMAYVDTVCRYCNKPIVIIRGSKYNRYGIRYKTDDIHDCKGGRVDGRQNHYRR